MRVFKYLAGILRESCGSFAEQSRLFPVVNRMNVQRSIAGGCELDSKNFYRTRKCKNKK